MIKRLHKQLLAALMTAAAMIACPVTNAAQRHATTPSDDDDETIITGSVVDATSSWGYITGAEVTLSLDGVTVGSDETFYGAFQIEVASVTDLPYTITVSKAGYDTYTNELSLTPGDYLQLNIKLWPEGTTPAQGTTVKGSVTSLDSGEAIAGAEVSLLENDSPIVSAVTGETGNFELHLDRVLNGSYDLTVKAEGYTDVVRSISFDAGSTPVVSVAMETAVTSGTLSVEVVEAGSSRTLSDVRGILSKDGAKVGEATSYWGIMEFEVDNITPGAYTLALTLEGYEPLTVDDIELVAGETVSRRIEMTKAVVETTVVKGVVVTGDGDTPVATAKVVLKEGDRTLDYEFTGNDGSFEMTLRSKLNGDYLLVVTKDGYSDFSKTVTITDGECAEQRIVMELSLTTMRLTVIDSVTRKPVDGASFEIEEQYEPIADGKTDPEGLATVEFPSGNGIGYDLTVWARGYKTFKERRQFAKGEINEVTVELTPEGVALDTIGSDTADTQGRVYDLSGRLVKGTPAPGIYIVTDGTSSRRVIIR